MHDSSHPARCPPGEMLRTPLSAADWEGQGPWQATIPLKSRRHILNLDVISHLQHHYKNHHKMNRERARGHNPDTEDDDGFDPTPLENQRGFGAGLHKKRIAFVPASASNGQLTTTNPQQRPVQDISSLYLNLVLPSTARKPNPAPPEPTTLCTVCNLSFTPLTGTQEPPPSDPATTSTPHHSSLAHQLCLPHSHPPSALDRSRMGLSYLSTHGWDPDARRGLGAAQQGIQFPVKAKAKEDKLGVGMAGPKNGAVVVKEKERLLDAGKVRKMVAEEKRRAERIRTELCGRGGDLERYLGKGAVG